MYPLGLKKSMLELWHLNVRGTLKVTLLTIPPNIKDWFNFPFEYFSFSGVVVTTG